MKRLPVLLLGLALLPGVAFAQGAASATNPEVQQRLNELKAMKKELQDKMQDFDARIRKLEAAEKEQSAQAAAAQRAAAAPPVQKAAVEPPVQKTAEPPAANPPKPLMADATPPSAAEIAKTPPPPADPREPGPGHYEMGKGFVVARGRLGDMNVGVLAYARYLNQLNQDRSYTDAFGREKTVKLRQDIQLNKINLSFKGWVFDPDFSYRVFIWTQNAAQGEGAQVVIGGHLGYKFSDYLTVNAGIAALPSTRTTNWTFPYWLKMDNRTLADEFFRASYTQGVWAEGKLLDEVGYRVMIGNNLSALGISASQLDSGINTYSGAVWWMPTTGEYGPLVGFGDYENHQRAATMFGLHYTRSREDKQSQADPNSIENSQIRLSDGTQLFSLNAFNTPGQVNIATYQMMDFNAGVKYQGLSLEGEYYARWVDDFRVTGIVPVNSLFDQGYQIQASAMVIPRKLQAFVSGSQILGEYGDPWDVTLGLNWFPFGYRQIFINAQAVYQRRSPVGGISYPYNVGGNGWLFNTDFAVAL